MNVSLTYEKSTSRLKLNIVKARSLCCKALEGKRQDSCGVSCSGDLISDKLPLDMSNRALCLCLCTSKVSAVINYHIFSLACDQVKMRIGTQYVSTKSGKCHAIISHVIYPGLKKFCVTSK